MISYYQDINHVLVTVIQFIFTSKSAKIRLNIN